MKIVSGKYNSAKIFTDRVEDACIEQIRGLLEQEAFREARIRIMPDCHTGAGCVIGFTADLGDKIIPDIVGVDIGCGMLTVEPYLFQAYFRWEVCLTGKQIPAGGSREKQQNIMKDRGWRGLF